MHRIPLAICCALVGACVWAPSASAGGLLVVDDAGATVDIGAVADSVPVVGSAAVAADAVVCVGTCSAAPTSTPPASVTPPAAPPVTVPVVSAPAVGSIATPSAGVTVAADAQANVLGQDLNANACVNVALNRPNGSCAGSTGPAPTPTPSGNGGGTSSGTVAAQARRNASSGDGNGDAATVLGASEGLDGRNVSATAGLGNLPFTGVSVAVVAALGLGLVTLGLALWSRRRTTRMQLV